MSSASDLPLELLCRPVGLVVLTGLDVTFNAVHKAVWDSFCNNRRSDRVPLQLKVLAADNEYPKCRTKRTSYDWYVPKGILKSSWMRKHLELVPSAVIVFFDLDWDEIQWKERQMECATRVQIIRNSLQGRSCKVSVVLIQKNAPLPPGEDTIAADRAASLCSTCDVSAKALFVLPLSDHLLGYTIKLENAFYDLSQSYYHTCTRRVKAHKDILNKTTHQLLFVRHQFKIAFFNELRQDPQTALKHYKQAYSHALELRVHDTNVLEVKTIAGFVNYKICRLSFQSNAPLDAIAQFRKHIDYFKNRVGYTELAFEHSTWMSKQFQVFGELFDEAIKLGLTAIQTQHPGFYYQQAFNNALNRKLLCQKICHVGSSYPSPDPLENLQKLDYYGQRPWRQGHQSIDPPDLLKEREGILALHFLELTVDHSSIIIPLLSNAVAQFKKYKSPRMKRYLMVQLGEEYLSGRDYNKALLLLTRVMWEYRQEKWWPLLTSILNTALRCAYLVGSFPEYARICMELMGKYTLLPADEKIRIQRNFELIFQGQFPQPEPRCDGPEMVELACQNWLLSSPENQSKGTQEEGGILTVEMQSIVGFVECKARFEQDSFTADQLITLKIYVRTTCPLPIRFSKLSVLLSNQIYNCGVVDDEATLSDITSSLYFLPNVIKAFTFTFVGHQDDIGKLLEVTTMTLELGTEGSGRRTILLWTGGGGDAVVPSLSQQQLDLRLRTFREPITSATPWENIYVQPVARLHSRVAKMSIRIEHSPPALVNEIYQLKMVATSEEQVEVSNVRLLFGLGQSHDRNAEQSTRVSIEKPDFEGKIAAISELGNMQPQEQLSRLLLLKNSQTGNSAIFLKVSYEIEQEMKGHLVRYFCHKEETLSIPVVSPLSISVRLMSMQFEKIESPIAEEPFLLLTDIKCLSPWPIQIQSSHLRLSKFVKLIEDSGVENGQLDKVRLKKNECASECVCVVAPEATGSAPVHLGEYDLICKGRCSEKDDAEKNVSYDVTTTQSLPSVLVEHVPLVVNVHVPAYGCVRQSMPVTYTVHNCTPFSQLVEATMEGSDAFMFAGYKQFQFRVLANDDYRLAYNFVPLLPGNLTLPRLRVNMLRYPNSAIDSAIEKMLLSNVFVLPTGRNATIAPSANETATIY